MIKLENIREYSREKITYFEHLGVISTNNCQEEPYKNRVGDTYLKWLNLNTCLAQQNSYKTKQHGT